MGKSEICNAIFTFTDIYIETNTMSEQNLQKQDKMTPEQEMEEKRRIEKEFIKQFNCFSKTYPKTEWWDWDSD